MHLAHSYITNIHFLLTVTTNKMENNPKSNNPPNSSILSPEFSSSCAFSPHCPILLPPFNLNFIDSPLKLIVLHRKILMYIFPRIPIIINPFHIFASFKSIQGQVRNLLSVLATSLQIQRLWPRRCCSAHALYQCHRIRQRCQILGSQN